MARGMRMFAGVLVRRAVAAERHAACLAGPQMNPAITNLYALFAFPALGLLD